MCVLVNELKKESKTIVGVTGQHCELLQQVMYVLDFVTLNELMD